MWLAIVTALTAFFKSIPVIGDWLKRREERKAKEKAVEDKASAYDRWQQKDANVKEAIRRAGQRNAGSNDAGMQNEESGPTQN